MISHDYSLKMLLYRSYIDNAKFKELGEASFSQ